MESTQINIALQVQFRVLALNLQTRFDARCRFGLKNTNRDGALRTRVTFRGAAITKKGDVMSGGG